MKAKSDEKAKAIELRKQGLTYKEILAELPVAKSSLSLWFKDLPLSSVEKQVLKKRKNSNISRGRMSAAASNRKHKLARDTVYRAEAKIEFVQHCQNPLFHTGIALYWAEGAKRNAMFHFMNSDEAMIDVFLKWLESFTEYTRHDIGYRLYLHEPFRHDNWEQWWQKKLGVSGALFKKTIIKPSGVGVKKHPNYKGCLRIEVPRSVHLLVKMKLWINLLVADYHKR